jgi:hypothetical protein
MGSGLWGGCGKEGNRAFGVDLMLRRNDGNAERVV